MARSLAHLVATRFGGVSWRLRPVWCARVDDEQPKALVSAREIGRREGGRSRFEGSLDLPAANLCSLKQAAICARQAPSRRSRCARVWLNHCQPATCFISTRAHRATRWLALAASRGSQAAQANTSARTHSKHVSSREKRYNGVEFGSRVVECVCVCGRVCERVFVCQFVRRKQSIGWPCSGPPPLPSVLASQLCCCAQAAHRKHTHTHTHSLSVASTRLVVETFIVGFYRGATLMISDLISSKVCGRASWPEKWSAPESD